jgi:hypothetical protein
MLVTGVSDEALIAVVLNVASSAGAPLPSKATAFSVNVTLFSAELVAVC